MRPDDLRISACITLLREFGEERLLYVFNAVESARGRGLVPPECDAQFPLAEIIEQAAHGSLLGAVAVRFIPNEKDEHPFPPWEPSDGDEAEDIDDIPAG